MISWIWRTSVRRHAVPVPISSQHHPTVATIMQAEVISIGDELTSGQRLDTNSQWLSQQLGEIGVAVFYHTTVADDLAANVRVFAEAAARADVVIATGGLGPTADDLTREALATVLGVELVLDEPSLGLAPMVVQDIFRTIRAINATGTSVLLVEQNARYAFETASRGYVLQTGSMIASGSCADLKQNPRVQEAYLGRITAAAVS